VENKFNAITEIAYLIYFESIKTFLANCSERAGF